MMRTIVALFTLAALLGAQQVPPPFEERPAASTVKGMLTSGDRERKAGRKAEAARAYREALRRRWADKKTLERLMTLCREDPDALTLWAHAYVDAATSARGGVAASSSARKLLPKKDAALKTLPRARARAAQELYAFARKQSENGSKGTLHAALAAALATEVMGHTPALLKAHAAGFNKLFEPRLPDAVALLAGLKTALTNAEASGDLGRALEIALCMRSFLAQAAFKDLVGPRPEGLARFGPSIQTSLNSLRERLREKQKPLDLDELEALDANQRERFNREHSRWSNPAVVESPEKHYRIETICGIETLLGVANTVDFHHARLVDHFGKDPFQGRQGIIRIVPESEDMESEGAPYWWAAGFQGGDITTLRFACSTIEGLGHTITHELTHRFDQAINPGLPAWLSEGHGEWTGKSYGHHSDPSFVEHYGDASVMEEAYIKGYANRDNLERLLKGTIDDYRDNYVAGYALYLYLLTWWKGDQRIYASRLPEYLQSFGKAGDPVSTFASFFADGVDGRPKGMKAFLSEWRDFLKGFHWLSIADWTRRYHVEFRRRTSPIVLDHHTWTWAFENSEPEFGQEIARRAGLWLLLDGQKELAAEAWCWALRKDEWTPPFANAVAALLDGLGDKKSAWVVRSEAHRRFPVAAPKPGPSPLLGQLPRTKAFLEALESASKDYEKRLLRCASYVLARDHDRIAALLGRPLLAPGEPPKERLQDPLYPINRPARSISIQGYEEDRLHGYESKRVKDLWYTTESGDLHVGRKKAKGTSESESRRAHQRHAFARTRLRLPRGRHLLSAQIFPTTSYVEGALVLGFRRRDRNVRVHFTLGDYEYAIGEKEDKNDRNSVRCRIDGLRIRDGALSGTLSEKVFEYEGSVSSFLLEVLIDGPTLSAFVDGRHLGNYSAPDGLPLEGHLGFAASDGAYRVQQPTLTVMDRHRSANAPRAMPPGLSLASPGEDAVMLETRSMLPVEGLPQAADGTILFWVWATEKRGQKGVFDPERSFDDALTVSETLVEYADLSSLYQKITVAVPALIGEERMTSLQEKLEAISKGRFHVVAHHWKTPQELRGSPKIMRSARHRLLFIDAYGILRVTDPIKKIAPRITHRLERWARVFHDQLEVGGGLPAKGVPPKK